MKLRHFIFDIDGTLEDTEKVILAAWTAALEQSGYHFEQEKLRSSVIGVTADVGFRRLGIQPKPGFFDGWRADYERRSRQVRPFPGVTDMLAELKGMGVNLGIMSSRSHNELGKYMPGIDMDVFGLMVLQEDTVEHKPHPEPLLRYASLAGVEPGECIYIGDVTSDIECAVSAGTASGLVAWNNSGVTCPAADYVFHTPAQVVELARRQMI